MTYDTLMNLVFGSLVVIYGLLLVVIITNSLWQGVRDLFREWYRNNRNKRLCDYHLDDNDYCLLKPMMDGLIDREWYYQEVFPKKPSIGNTTLNLSKGLCCSIDDRYYGRGAERAHQRGLKSLQMFAEKRHYYLIDIETQLMVDEAMELRDGLCFRCNGRGYYWESMGRGCSSECKCDCGQNRYEIPWWQR